MRRFNVLRHRALLINLRAKSIYIRLKNGILPSIDIAQRRNIPKLKQRAYEHVHFSTLFYKPRAMGVDLLAGGDVDESKALCANHIQIKISLL
jgi:hypothetical protein